MFPFFRHRLDLHMMEVLSGAAVALFLRLLGGISQLLFNIILARSVGAQGMGVYALAVSTSTLTSLIGRIGLDQTMLRFIAVHADACAWGKVKGVFARGMAIALFASTVTAVVLFLASPWLSVTIFHQPSLEMPMRWMALSVVPFSLLNLIAASLRSLMLTHYSFLIQVVLVPTIGCIVLLPLAYLGFGINGAVASYILSTVIVFIVALFLWRKSVTQGRQAIVEMMPAKEILEVSFPMAWVAVMTWVMSMADTVILGMYRPSSDVGIYTAALRIAMLSSFILVAVNSITAPKFAALYESGDIIGLGKLAKHSTRFMMLSAGPVLLLFIATPGFVMGIYGREFTAGAIPLTIISIGQLFNVATGSVGQILTMAGKQIVLRNIMIFSAILSIFLSLALIPKFGILGAALSNGISVVVVNLAAAYAVNRHLKISVCLY